MKPVLPAQPDCCPMDSCFCRNRKHTALFAPVSGFRMQVFYFGVYRRTHEKTAAVSLVHRGRRAATAKDYGLGLELAQFWHGRLSDNPDKVPSFSRRTAPAICPLPLPPVLPRLIGLCCMDLLTSSAPPQSTRSCWKSQKSATARQLARQFHLAARSWYCTRALCRWYITRSGSSRARCFCGSG